MARSPGRTLVAALAVGGALTVAAPAAVAAPFNCSASAVRATVLGTSLEPVSANAGRDACGPGRGAVPALPAPLAGGAAVAQTALERAGELPAVQQATATASVADFTLGALPALPLALPAAQLPAGLDAVKVPLSSALQLLGLPSEIVVNALPAARALVPVRTLPDLNLVDVHLARSDATAACVNGAPTMSGASTLEGVKVLGQELPTNQIVDRVVRLLDTRTISLSGLSADAVQLPAGLSFDLPVVGPLLETAVSTVLKGLPPIQFPGAIAEVKATPAERSESDGTLVQRALHVRVTVLGREVADVVLGEARVAAAGVDCSMPEPAPASKLAVSCAKRKVTLVNVIESRDHVSLLGAAERTLVGRTVDIVLTATGKRVASGVVRPDGFFRAKAPLPPKAIRFTNLARYQAVIDGQRSLRLKLHRRMHISRMRHRGGRVIIVGRVAGPVANHEAIVIRRRVSCTKDVIVKRIKPGSDGRWRVTLPAPPNAQAAVYRATTQVLGGDDEPKVFPTFTLPGYVSL